MEEVLGVLGFSLGASLGIGAVRSIGQGAEPVLRSVLKVGIRAWDAAAGGTAAMRQEMKSAADEARAEAAPRPRRTRSAAQKIEVART